MRIAIAIVLGLVIGVGQSAYSQTQSSPDPRVSDMVQSGKLRIGVFPSFQYSNDASGKPQGLALGNALAADVSIREVVTVEYPTPPQVIACVKEGGCDVGFMLVDPARAKEVDFTPAFVRSDFAYLVPPGSPLKPLRTLIVRAYASRSCVGMLRPFPLFGLSSRRNQCTRRPMIQHLNYCGPGRQTHLRPYARCLSNTRHSFLARGS